MLKALYAVALLGISKAFSLKEIIQLDPGVRLLAENITVTIPRKLTVNGVEKLENIIFSAGKLDLDYQELQKGGASVVDYAEFSSSINKSHDPCDNFYEFVCGGWQKSHPILPHEFMNSQTETVSKLVMDQYRALFNEPTHFAQSRERQLMLNLYRKCMDSVERNKLGSQPLFEMMRKIRRADLKFITDWFLLVQPRTVFFDLMVTADEYNSSKNTLEVYPQAPFLSFQYYGEPAYRNQLISSKQFLRDILRLLSSDDLNREFFSGTEEEIQRRLDSFMYTDSKLAMISERTSENNTSIEISLYELEKFISSINIKRYITQSLPPELHRKINLDNCSVTLRNTEAIRMVNSLVSTIDNQTLADYLDWKIIIAHLPQMDDRFKRVFEEFNFEVYGVQPHEDLSDNCIKTTTQAFEDVAGALYIEKYFNQETVHEMHEMVHNIRSSFGELLEENQWMDEATKKKARLKANAIAEFIGFNPAIFDQNITSRRYENLQYDISWPAYNIYNTISQWAFRNSFHKLIETNSKNSFEFLASDVNAFYDPSQNHIALLSGMLQRPFFNASLPRALNYGSIGVVTGHEITHGFDNYGSLFDENGNRNNWWDATTLQNFNNYKQCFVDQYDNVTIDSLSVKIDGHRTEAENIADNGGMRAALRAVKKILRNPKENTKKVRGLEEYTMMQLFFMNYAFSWCGNWRLETLLTDLASDSHAPDFTRVNVVLSNQPEFAEAFKCPRNSKMVAENACVLW